MKASPPKAIGSFSESLMSSIFEEKYSSGSFSLVMRLLSSSGPRPRNTVVLETGAFAVLEETVKEVDGANAFVEMRIVARTAKMYVRRFIVVERMLIQMFDLYWTVICEVRYVFELKKQRQSNGCVVACCFRLSEVRKSTTRHASRLDVLLCHLTH